VSMEKMSSINYEIEKFIGVKISICGA
jgi:hypothetical protein